MVLNWMVALKREPHASYQSVLSQTLTQGLHYSTESIDAIARWHALLQQLFRIQDAQKQLKLNPNFLNSGMYDGG